VGKTGDKRRKKQRFRKRVFFRACGHIVGEDRRQRTKKPRLRKCVFSCLVKQRGVFMALRSVIHCVLHWVVKI